MSAPRPILQPLGDRALLVRFADSLSEAANLSALALAERLQADDLPGVTEIVPNLVSVQIGYDPAQASFEQMAGEIRLRLARVEETAHLPDGADIEITVSYGGADGPDLEPLAAELGLSAKDFVKAHAAARLRVLATGFAPGFVYCGFHDELPSVPRRNAVRRQVPAGSVLFAAGQTAIAATVIPTGWHVIGRTDFRNFDAGAEQPTRLRAGDRVSFPVDAS